MPECRASIKPECGPKVKQNKRLWKLSKFGMLLGQTVWRADHQAVEYMNDVWASRQQKAVSHLPPEVRQQGMD